MKRYPETHQKGHLSIEQDISRFDSLGIIDLGIQIAKDGRIWICINGQAWIQFNPIVNKYTKGVT